MSSIGGTMSKCNCNLLSVRPPLAIAVSVCHESLSVFGSVLIVVPSSFSSGNVLSDSDCSLPESLAQE